MTQPLKFILESILFVSEEPLSVQQFKSLLESEETDAIQGALEALTAEYDLRGGGFELRQVAGGYQFRTRSEYSEWVKKLLKPSPARLSRAALETLAIIAYKQPVIRADIEHIRGVDCGGVLRMLLEKKLIRVMGRKDIPGRPMIYGTTRQFLEVFNLKDLRDLPSPKEIESLGAEIDMEFAASVEPDTDAISDTELGPSPSAGTASRALLDDDKESLGDASHQASASQDPQVVLREVPGDDPEEGLPVSPAGGDRSASTAPADREDTSLPDSDDGNIS